MSTSYGSTGDGPRRTTPSETTHHETTRHIPDADGATAADARSGPHDVAREKEQFGGIKFGSAFFGWLTATGTAVLLTALVAAAGTAVGIAKDTNVSEAAGAAVSNPTTAGITSAIVLLLVLLISYYCGGYVAGRMARFNGAKQGVAVWLWAVLIAIAVAVLGAVAGNKFDVLARLNAFPRLPLNEGTLTTGGLIALVVAALASLIGAILGGLAGMRFHRKVDKAGLRR